MRKMSRIFLLAYMVTAASLAFNIDTRNPELHVGEQDDFFGYKVLQFASGTNKGIIVTAPLQRNGSGGICKSVKSQIKQCFNSEGITIDDTRIPIKHLGLSVVRDSTWSQFTVCSPSVVHGCNMNSYLNSVCYNLTDNLQEISNFTPAFQDCTKQKVDLVFLFDGSGSMTEAEFDKNKDFIMDIMQSLMGSSIKFAAVQFSTDYRKVFDFNDYDAGTAHANLMAEPQMGDLTNTHKALNYVYKDILVNPGAGASPDATKVLVLVTDGDPTDTDRYGIIKKYDVKKVIRFVIGLKDAKLEKFRAIASEPKDKNAFKIENYNGLKGSLENFQVKIFNMEGSTVARSGNMTNEMSQSGFSAVFHKDTLILGSVGSNSWSGALQELHEQKQTQIKDPHMSMDSYMGYSVSVGEKNNTSLYFSGAPRFEHKGQVVVFRHDGYKWTAEQRIDGEQIGCYFGAELCSVDVDSDGDADFLLVGAPLFYQSREKGEGKMYVYRLTDKMRLKSELNVTASSMGRFGTSISSLADLNGDGLRDVAVGAPLEDDYRGAVYIFLGDKHRGIRSTFSQRIMGQKMNPGMKFFGQAIDGDIDLGEDGLPDIVVGSKGMAVVLRSRPVFNVSVRLSFQPKEISTDKIDCLAKTDEDSPMVNLTVCFEMIETTKSKAGAPMSISCTLYVDPTKQTNRGFFSELDKNARHLSATYRLQNNDTCFTYSIRIPKCVRDTITPISFKANFTQHDSENATATLNAENEMQAVVEIPFEKQCQSDICIADLEVDFAFATETLLVAQGSNFSLSVKLLNHGDDSYNTRISMSYPAGFFFSKMTLIEKTRPIRHRCDEEGVLEKQTTCAISHPVYRSRSAADFQATFNILPVYDWNDTVSFTITGISDNTNSTRNNSLSKSIPVQFEIKMAITVKEDTVNYLSFTTDDTAAKKMVTIFKIDNPGFKAFPVNVVLVFPTKLERNFEMENYQVLQNKTQCTNVTDAGRSDYCSPEKSCKVITCDSFILDKKSAVEFKLSGDVQFRDLKQQASNIAFLKRYTGDSAEVRFKSFIRVTYDKQRYVLDSYKQANKDGFKEEKPTESGSWEVNDQTTKAAEARVELVILQDRLLIYITGGGLGFLLLLIITVIMFKLGCFKRKTPQRYQVQEEEAALQTELTPDGSQSKADKTSDPPSEEKTLLDDGDAHNVAMPEDKDNSLD